MTRRFKMKNYFANQTLKIHLGNTLRSWVYLFVDFRLTMKAVVS